VAFDQLVRDSFARQEFMRTIGAEITTVGPGSIEIDLAVRPSLCQQHGFVHAGVISAIADSAVGYAALSLLPEGADVLTAEFKINLLAPAKGERLIARARILRSGKRLSVARSDVFARAGGDETMVAALLGTIAHRLPQ
jgi:uncharacterized protein (TIGR00369 family)